MHPFVRGGRTGWAVPSSAVGESKAQGDGKDGHRSELRRRPDAGPSAYALLRALRAPVSYTHLDSFLVETYFGTYYQVEKVLDYVAGADLGMPYGVNCLNVDAMGFELARKFDCDYLQLDSVVGHVKPRDEDSLDAFFKLYRERCKAYVIGGVRFKYQPVLSEHTVAEDLKIAMTRCDAICVTQDLSLIHI